MSTITPYAGASWQRGYGLGSMFRGLFKTAMPLVKGVGRKLLKAGVRGGARLAQDALRGRDIKKSAKRRFANALGSVLRNEPPRKRAKLGVRRIRTPAPRRVVSKARRRAVGHTGCRNDVFGAYV